MKICVASATYSVYSANIRPYIILILPFRQAKNRRLMYHTMYHLPGITWRHGFKPTENGVIFMAFDDDDEKNLLVARWV